MRKILQTIFLLTLVYLAAPIIVAQENKSGVKPQVLSIPSGPGSIEGLGGAFEPQLNTGTSSYSVKLSVPAGRNGFQPELSLSYNSGNANGPLGIGWNLGIPAIVRQIEKGQPTYSDQDRFEYAGEELIPLTDGTYATRNAGSFMRFYRSGDHWEAKDKSGKLYRFGLYPQPSNGRISRTGKGDLRFDYTYRWVLNELLDTSGNKIEYFYRIFVDSPGQLYLSEIRYNGELGPYQSVQFYFEDRPDQLSNYHAGFLVKTGKRISKIKMVSDQQPVREYHLAYKLESEDLLFPEPEGAIEFNFSYLSKITQYDSTGLNTLPPLRLEYTKLFTRDADRYPTGNFPGPEDIDLNQNGIQDIGTVVSVEQAPHIIPFHNGNADFMDVNGDGLPDIYTTNLGTHYYYLNQSDNTFGARQEMQGAPLQDLSDDNITIADLDGDGLSDMLVNPGAGRWHFYRNQGNGSYAAPVINNSAPPFALTGSDTKFLDLNYDKKIDIVRTNPNGNWSYCLSQEGMDTDHAPFGNFPGPEDVDKNRDGTIDVTPWQCIGSTNPAGLPDSITFQNPKVRLADMNGDRLQDMVTLSISDNSATVVYWPAKGLAEFDLAVIMTGQLAVGPVDPQNLKLRDVNGDGLTDLIKVRSGQVTVWFNLGNQTWSTPAQFGQAPSYNPMTTWLRFADMNGNGTTDLVWIEPSSPDKRIQYLDFSGRTKANQLHVIDNGLGRRIQIQYQSTTEMKLAARNDGNDWTINTPFPSQVVSQVLTHTGLDLDTTPGNDVLQVDIVYRNPWYDPYQKQFRGFDFVKKIETGDDTSPTLLTRIFFHTGAPDGIDNDSDGKIDERGEFGETEELPLRGKILTQETTTAEAGAYTSVKDGQPSDTTHTFQRLENNWGIQRIHDISGGTQGVPTMQEQEVSFAYHLEENLTLYELGNGPAKHLRKTFLSDAYGNAIEEKVYGVVDEAGDEIFSYQTYAYNTDAWIVGAVHTSFQTDGDGTKISETRTYYDGEAFVGLPLGQVEKGLVTRQEKWVKDSTYLNVARSQYNSYGIVTETMDGNDNRRSYEYDELFQTFPTKETMHLGDTKPPLVMQAEYDLALGKITRVTDFNGQLTHYTYDSFGRPVHVIRPGDSFEFPGQIYSYRMADPHRGQFYDYSQTGTLITSFGSDSLVSRISTHARELQGQAGTLDSFQFVDGLGRKLGTLNEDTTGYIFSEAALYNIRGKPIARFQPYSVVDTGFHRPQLTQTHSRIWYDAQGRPVRTQTPPDNDGIQHETSVAYRPLHTISTDENGHLKEAFKNGRDNITRVLEHNQGATYTTSYLYDVLGNLTQITDAQNNIKRLSYDGLGRKTWMDDPDKGIMEYSYDDAGNLIQTRDNKNQVITYSYDAVNRLTKEDFDDPAFPGVEVVYTYDAASPDYPLADNLKGKLAYVTDLSGGAFFSYDPQGNVSWQIKRINQHNGEKDYRTSFNYDGLNRLVSQVWPDGEGVRYEYDTRGLLTEIPGLINRLQYEVSGQLSLMDYANGITAEYAYDPRQRISELKSRDSGNQTIQHLTYQLDGVGNITRIQDERPISGSAPNYSTQDFQYDHLSRLTQASGVYGTINFQYDAIGNMIHKNSPVGVGHVDDVLINLGEMTYGGTAGSSNRTGKGTQPGPHAISATASGLSYDYDANGNMISHATGDQYEWDYKDRLTHVVKDGNHSWYTYDHSGQRVSKKVQVGAGYEYTYYITKDYEIRDQDAYKYVFAGSKRIARIKSTIQSGTLETQTIQLQPGWNFVSFTLDPVDPDPNEVFAGILPQLIEVYAHQQASDEFVFFKPGELSNLFTIEAYQGYVIHMSAAAELTVTGMRPDRPLELKQGWNLVGFPVTGNLSTVLEQIQHDYDVIWGFDASSDNWMQMIKGTNLPPGFNSLSTIAPGKAYWVRTLRDTVFAPSMEFSGQPEFYHPDHLGSTNLTTDQTGVVISETAYYPFGRPRYQQITTGPGDFYTYTGKELDQTGLFYYEARYMDPVIGRFISVDPLLVETPDKCGIQECNLYSYTTNNPIGFIDPTGTTTKHRSWIQGYVDQKIENKAQEWESKVDHLPDDASFRERFGTKGSARVYRTLEILFPNNPGAHGELLSGGGALSGQMNSVSSAASKYGSKTLTRGKIFFGTLINKLIAKFSNPNYSLSRFLKGRDPSYFFKLKQTSSFKFGPKGSLIPEYGKPNSFAHAVGSEGKYAVVYGPDGRSLMEVNSKRIKMHMWNQNANGKWHRNRGTSTKLFKDGVPSNILNALNIE